VHPVLLLFGLQQIVGVDVFEPDKDPLAAGVRRLLDKVRDAVAQRVDLDGNWSSRPSCSRISISRSKIASESRLRAKLSSVMKKRKTPWARLARTRRSTSSASRQRDLRPCTLMIVQKLH
jgi:hypothetical protein